jgi:hypothetical protein
MPLQGGVPASLERLHPRLPQAPQRIRPATQNLWPGKTTNWETVSVIWHREAPGHYTLGDTGWWIRRETAGYVIRFWEKKQDTAGRLTEAKMRAAWWHTHPDERPVK